MIQSVSKKYSGVSKNGFETVTLGFFPEIGSKFKKKLAQIGSNCLILNISTFRNQFASNLGSDYLCMFKKNSLIYWHFLLPETQWLYYSLLNQEC
jgi:hypothetical protein